MSKNIAVNGTTYDASYVSAPLADGSGNATFRESSELSLQSKSVTPTEAERLQGFDDEWTNSGMPQRMRFFCMGNALVVPMITRMGRILDSIIANEP